jgi:DNA processing protein
MYTLGKILKKDKNALAVVGSREVTPRGRALTRKFVKELTRAGLTIVSGLARGVDSIAHKTALEEGGRTIAVLGSGLDIIYPPENAKLASEIVKNGALVSPFPYGTKPYGKNFLARNKVIVSLSKAVLVIEGKRRSGTLSTASHAANEGKEVFVIPGSEATDWLADQGAAIAKSPEDIIEYLRSI